MSPSLHLILQYCNHPLPARQAEYDYCFRRNLNNPHVRLVHNLVDGDTLIPDEFTAHPKYRQGSRAARFLTYREAFAYCSQNLPNELACILNLDIFLDDTGTDWSLARPLLEHSIVLALSRLEFDGVGGVSKDPAFARYAFGNTQDAWIFHSPFDVPDCDFGVGMPGCDNAIAERIKRTGRLPVNAASRFKIFHYDRARGKTVANQKEVHARERQGLPRLFPEEQGQYMLPDIDLIHSVDEMLRDFEATELKRYQIICDAMSQLNRVSNR